MSGRRALLMALRKVVGSRQTGLLPGSARGKERVAAAITKRADKSIERGDLDSYPLEIAARRVRGQRMSPKDVADEVADRRDDVRALAKERASDYGDSLALQGVRNRRRNGLQSAESYQRSRSAPRTNASPISVVDNEFDAPVRAAASSPSLPPAAALQAMPMARLKALFESYMGEPLARRSLTTRKDIIFEMEERARALDAADTIKRHS